MERGSSGQWLPAKPGIQVDVVEREPGVKGFSVARQRRALKRNLDWLSQYRHWSLEYENWVTTADAMIYAGMVQLMLRRLEAV